LPSQWSAEQFRWVWDLRRQRSVPGARARGRALLQRRWHRPPARPLLLSAARARRQYRLRPPQPRLRPVPDRRPGDGGRAGYLSGAPAVPGVACFRDAGSGRCRACACPRPRWPLPVGARSPRHRAGSAGRAWSPLPAPDRSDGRTRAIGRNKVTGLRGAHREDTLMGFAALSPSYGKTQTCRMG